MSTYQQRGYTVEVGFAVGHLPEGPVDPDSFRTSRQEAEAALREMEEFVQQESKTLPRMRRSQIRMLAISSSSAGTACRFNRYGERCWLH